MRSARLMSRRNVILTGAALPWFSSLAIARESGDGMTIQRLGWAGIRMSAGKVDLFIDASGSIPPDQLDIERYGDEGTRAFALATHHHSDHLDLSLLKSVLGDRGYLVVHKEAAQQFDNRQVNVQAVDLYEPVFFPRSSGKFTAWAVPAADGFGSPQVSWVVDCGGRRIIHCGDTLWHGHWWNIARAYGPIDVAFLPINGARQFGGMIADVGQSMMLTPEQAAAAASALGARIAVPIHYGNGESDSYIEIPNAEKRFVAAAEKQNVAIRVLQPGETLEL